ncbi:response regulator receiver protein [Solidesulfovibrio carbinoliphilus subsp. oakridgensis]|uniref:Response regulator receiver protein n=1 Tax=Solidesulfovibrio carbinoliphilus subsp. oakridgensis TaxID=694327 RepID=G7QBG5_9BACT|nr:response regulator [Solidesulfovibrio carbinoliphilus]EHJ49388.1 response regulator receiver protein [Solidesulfovibrio carbinoliphilus subsp. oakridgensis]
MADPIRVLIVDDEERFRDTLAKLLTRHGFAVRTAGGGQEALALLGAAPADVIVLDVKMPGLSGQEALPLLRAACPEAEVLILTGHASVDIASAMIAGGAADYLLKPCPTDELEGAIRAVYDRRQATRPR